VRFRRSSGILLHPTSLPGPWGIGDLGDEARAFVDFIAASGQRMWQVLPLGPTGYGDSPYQCFSAFAGNPLLVSPRHLIAEGLLAEADAMPEVAFPDERVHFREAIGFKNQLLLRAYRNSKRSNDARLAAEFSEFCAREASWLDDYALFRALKQKNGEEAWWNWEVGREYHEARSSPDLTGSLAGEIEAHKFYQFLFFRQWDSLRGYCRERNITIIGDLPIFVANDSVDVWSHRELFKLDQNGAPLVVAGVPPDYFSATGQLWGNPVYDWARLATTGFEWWIRRMRSAFSLFDIVRIDHFRGFAATWEVPAGESTAENGQWVTVPGARLFEVLDRELGGLPVIAEDLGYITPDVHELRDQFGFPGMRVLQFAFTADTSNIDLPHNYVPNTIVYTGTHDNDTAVGWFTNVSGKGSTRDRDAIAREREFCLKYLRSNGAEINWDLIRTAFASVSDLAITPLQDVLGLDSTARMNLPASTSGNWSWRFDNRMLTREIGSRLREMSQLYGRCGSWQPPF
jgi:4-alpha-glucanotransferase